MDKTWGTSLRGCGLLGRFGTLGKFQWDMAEDMREREAGQ